MSRDSAAISCCGGPVQSASEEVRAYLNVVSPRWDDLWQDYATEEVRAEVLRGIVPHADMRVADTAM